MDRTRSVLLIVDMQDKVLRLVPGHEVTLERCEWLSAMARDLDVPVIASEHYARGLGPVNPNLRTPLGDARVAGKEFFSCVEDGCLEGIVGAEREQWIVCGIEAHACVMLTALDLAASGREVFVVSDAIASRGEEDRSRAIDRMAAAGVVPVTREMVLFEWLRKAGTPEFKDISKKYLQ